MTKRAVTYARVSGNDRAKTGGENLADQTRLCREYAFKSGYDLVADFAEDDRGASGATFDLPELAKVLDLARNGGFDVLIVRELDRLSRDLAKQLIVEQELKQAGVAIEYVLYDFPDTPEGNLNKNFRAMLAEYEREKIKQRMVRGRRRKAKNGEVMHHGKAPLGYRCVVKDNKQALEIVESEAVVVRLIFDLYTKGDTDGRALSIEAIRTKLDALGIPTYVQLRNDPCLIASAAVRGQTLVNWARSSVSHILSCETYAGVWHYGSKPDEIAVEVPTIIDPETWEAAQARKDQNKRLSKRNTQHEYLMHYRLRCGSCGASVRATTTTHRHKGGVYVYPHYTCTAGSYKRECSIATRHFSARDVDAATWAWVRGLLLDEDGLKQSLQVYHDSHEETAAPLRKRLEIVTGLIKDREQQITRLLDLYLNGDFSRDVLSERKARITQELTELRAEGARLDTSIREETLSESAINTVLEFGRAVREGIAEADRDFQKRREIINALDVTGELSIEDGEKVLYLHCVIGESRLFVSNNIGTCGHKTQPFTLSVKIILDKTERSNTNLGPDTSQDALQGPVARFSDSGSINDDPPEINALESTTEGHGQR